MIIRDAREADLPAIVAIYNATIPERMATADTEPVSVESDLVIVGRRLQAPPSGAGA